MDHGVRWATGRELATIDYPVPRYSGRLGRQLRQPGRRFQRRDGVREGFPAGGGAAVANGGEHYPGVVLHALTVSALTFRNGCWRKTGSTTALPVCKPMALATLRNGGRHGQRRWTRDHHRPNTIDSAGTLKCQSGMAMAMPWTWVSWFPAWNRRVLDSRRRRGMDAHDGATCSFYFKTTEPVLTPTVAVPNMSPGNETSATCYCGSCTSTSLVC